MDQGYPNCWFVGKSGLSIQKETVANQTVDPADLNEVVKTTKKEDMDSFCPK